jgi:hypothetical protein
MKLLFFIPRSVGSTWHIFTSLVSFLFMIFSLAPTCRGQREPRAGAALRHAVTRLGAHDCDRRTHGAIGAGTVSAPTAGVVDRTLLGDSSGVSAAWRADRLCAGVPFVQPPIPIVRQQVTCLREAQCLLCCFPVLSVVLAVKK